MNHLRWVCPKTWTPIYDNAVTFGESVTALCLPPCPPDFEYKQITDYGLETSALSRLGGMTSPSKNAHANLPTVRGERALIHAVAIRS